MKRRSFLAGLFGLPAARTKPKEPKEPPAETFKCDRCGRVELVRRAWRPVQSGGAFCSLKCTTEQHREDRRYRRR